MIEWSIGNNGLEGYILKILCVMDTKSIINDPEEKSYQLVLFKKGSTILNVNGKRIVINAPYIFTLSDKDSVEWLNPEGEYELDVIYFHPSVINHLFNTDNVETGNFNVEWQDSINLDRYMHLPFFERKVPYGGILSVDLNTFNRIQQLSYKLEKQINTENDGFWPCRSRSYLIEILIILQMRYVDNSAPKEFLN